MAQPAPVRSAYQIGDAVLVTLDTSGGVLTVESAVPGVGWAVVVSWSVDATNIEVQLQSESSLVAFRANLLLGVVSTSVEVVEPAAPGGNPVVVVTTQPAAPGATVAPITTPSVSVAAVPSTTDAHGRRPCHDDRRTRRQRRPPITTTPITTVKVTTARTTKVKRTTDPHD